MALGLSREQPMTRLVITDEFSLDVSEIIEQGSFDGFVDESIDVLSLGRYGETLNVKSPEIDLGI